VEVLIPERYRAAHPQHRERYAENPSVRPMGLWRTLSALRRDGTEVPVDVCLSEVKTSSEAYVLAAIRDVTERRRMEAMIQSQQEQLRQKHKLEAIGSLAGGVAHEFNNALQIISAYSALALDSLRSSDPSRHDLIMVCTAAKRARMLTRQLLGFCRRQPLDQQIFDPNALVAETAEFLRPLIGENIELSVALDEQAPWVSGDVDQLQQVLTNLCINARDAMPEGGKLTISTQRGGDRPGAACGGEDAVAEPSVTLIVTDTGHGMSPEVQRRIFEPFFTTKDVGQGTGLGLSMAYGIVQQHQGAIGLSSTLGRGTTFRIVLPATDKAIAVAATPPSRGASLCLDGDYATILAVEDILDAQGAELPGSGVARERAPCLLGRPEHRFWTKG
jgi:signal transduction histidine kinase